MTEPVEKILRQEARANREQAADMSRNKLDAAVRKGIAEGQGRARRRRVRYASGGVLAFAAALLLTWAALQPAGSLQPQPTVSAQQDWGELEVFREAVEGDAMIVGALDRGVVQPMNVSEEKNGYTVTLRGVAADSRSMFLLYSVKNGGEQEAVVDGDTVEYDNGSRGASSSSGGSTRIESGRTSYRVMSVLLEPGTENRTSAALRLVLTPDTPEAFASSSNRYRTEIEMPFELDRSPFLAKEHVWENDRTLSIDGQNIHVLRTVTTPIAIYVDIAYDDSNTKKVFGLIRPRLSVERGGASEELSWAGAYSLDGADAAESLKFAGTGSQDADSVTLEIDGISALEPDKLKLVIDANSMQVLQAPDGVIGVESAGDAYGKGYIALKRTGEYTEGMAGNMLLGSMFTDGDGVKHSAETGSIEGQIIHSSTDQEDGETVSSDYLYIGEDKWPQPLTFTVESYPNAILEAGRIRID